MDIDAINKRVASNWSANNGTAGMTSNNRVAVSIDPQTNQLRIAAPQYFVDSPEFQKEILPMFQKLKGQSLDDTNVANLLSTDNIQKLNAQLSETLKTVEIRNEFKTKVKDIIPEINDQAANYALYNISQASRSDNDDTTQIVSGILDGKTQTTSVKKFVDAFKKLNDVQKGQQLQGWDRVAKDTSLSPEERAIAVSLPQFLSQKGLTKASTGTDVALGINESMGNFANSFVGRVASAPLELAQLAFGGDGRNLRDQAQASIDNDPRNRLESGMTRDALGTVGSLQGLTADLGASLLTGGAAVAGIGAATRGAGRVASNLLPNASAATSNALKSLAERAPGVTSFATQTAREVPSNLAFGVTQAATQDDFDFANNFLLDTAIGAGALGAGRVIKSGIQAVERSSAGGKLADINDKITRNVYKVGNAIEDIPLVGKVIKGIGKNVISSTAQIERGLRRAYANGDIDRDQYLTGLNTVKRSVKGSSALTEGQLQGSQAFRQMYDQNNALAKTSQEARQSAIDYTTNRMILDNIEAGRYTATAKQRQQVEQAVAQTDSAQSRAYYDSAVALNDEITRLGTEYGILDDQIIQFMKDSPDFADRYIHLQFDVNSKTPYTGQVVTNRAQRNKRPVKRLKGLTENSAVDPMLTAVDRLGALNELRLQNDILVMMKNLGLANIVQDATTSARLNQARSRAEAAGSVVKRAVDRSEDDAIRLFSQDIEDIEDPLANLGLISGRVDQYLDDIVEDIVSDSQFRATVLNGVDEAVTSIDDVANEAIRINRNDILKQVDDALVNTELGADGRKAVRDMVESRIDARVSNTDAMSSVLSDNQAEIRQLNKDLSTDNTLVPGDQTADYFENGGRGKLSFNDPDVADYFTSNYSLPETKTAWKVLVLASRAFRAGTTGLNPIFNLAVNPTRDVLRSTVTAGTAVVTPRSVIQSLIEESGMTPAQAQEWYQRAQRTRQESLFNSTSMTFARSEPNRLQQYSDLKQMAERWARQEGGIKGKVIHVDRNPVRLVEDAFAAIDQEGVRRNVFDAVLQRSVAAGKTPEQALQDALFYADEATTSFWRAGQHTRQFVRTVPYLSAAINGQASFARLWALDPIGVTARMATGVALPVTILTINNLQNENYQNIPDYVKDTNFIVMQPDGSYLRIPVDYDIARVINPFRTVVEGMAQDDLNLFQTFADAVLNSTPIDLSGFTDRDFQGNIDPWQATARAISGLSPQLVQGIYEGWTGQDLYTGNAVGPTDTEIYDRGYVDAGQEIQNSDRTFGSRNSQTLGAIANFLGIPQSRVQNIVSNFSGQVGEFIVNAVDQATGAPESAQGGRNVGETLANRFAGDATTGGRRQTSYYDMVEDLEGKKEILLARIGRTDNEAQRQQLIDEYGAEVATAVNDYNNYYQDLGGLEPYQMDNVFRLLNLNENNGTFAEGTYQNANQEQLSMDARTEAERRAYDLGIPITTDRDRFGRLFDNNGTQNWDYGNVSTIPGLIESSYYGAPKQLAYEFNQLVSADRESGRPALYEEMRNYNDRLSKLYDEAKGKKGKAATEVYDRINAVQEEYMRDVFDPRIRPLIEEYGPSVLDNREVLDEIANLIMVPGDYTPFASRNKQPYLTDDTRAYILDRYGVGRLNQANRPSDDEAQAMIQAINTDLDNGRPAAASSKFDSLMDDINAGLTYVNYDNLETIRQLIKNANKR